MLFLRRAIAPDFPIRKFIAQWSGVMQVLLFFFIALKPGVEWYNEP